MSSDQFVKKFEIRITCLQRADALMGELMKTWRDCVRSMVLMGRDARHSIAECSNVLVNGDLATIIDECIKELEQKTTSRGEE